ncbi:MAG: HEAT repeat domain-containing protein [Planctomycetota bacterium]
MRRWLILFVLAGACGCAARPRLDPALQDPEDALVDARRRADAARTPAEELRLRRELLRKLLAAGWTPDAAREYARVRQLASGDEPALLRELCLGTLRWALRDADPGRRLGALSVARWLRLPEERLALAQVGLRDARAELRAAAATLAGGQLGEGGPAEAWALIEAAQADPAPQVREAAAFAVVGAGDPRRCAAALERALGDPDPLVRAAALRATRDALAAADRQGQHAWRAAAPRLLERCARLVQNGDLAVAQEAALALGARRATEAAQAWAAANHPGAEAAAFGRALRTPAAAPEPVREDLGSPELAVRLGAARGLAIGPARAALAEDLSGLLRADRSLAVRTAALRALRAARALDPALARELLRDPAPELRVGALQALVEVDGLEPAQAARLLDEGDPALAAELLAFMASRGQEPALVAACGRPPTRRAAVAALGRLGGSHGALRGLLGSELAEERRWALRGLAACGRGEDLPLLIEALGRFTDDLAAASAILSIWDRGGAPGFAQ